MFRLVWYYRLSVVCLQQKGYLQKRSTDSNRWQMRFFLLYQNLLFYYDQEQNIRPTGVIFLEGCYVDRIIAPSSTANSVVLSQTLAKNLKEEKLHVSDSRAIFYIKFTCSNELFNGDCYMFSTHSPSRTAKSMLARTN